MVTVWHLEQRRLQVLPQQFYIPLYPLQSMVVFDVNIRVTNFSPALQTVLQDAHDAPLTSLHFFPGEPRLMSAAADNSLKQWLFDNDDGCGRLLRVRSGHAAPPSCLRYYGDGTRLLSAGTKQQTIFADQPQQTLQRDMLS